MQDALTQWIQLFGNIAGISIIIYWLFDGIRNWNGSPELKILHDQLVKTNEHLTKLTDILSRGIKLP